MSTDRKSENRVVVYVESDLRDWLRSEHERLRVSIGEVVRRALRRSLPKKEQSDGK